MTDFDIGDPVRIDGSFYDAQDTLTDPTALKLKLKPPADDAVEYTYGSGPEIVRDAQGVFHATVDPEEISASPPGTWGGRWVATGVAKGAEPFQFFVRPEFYELWRPSVDDVALLLRTRARTAGGVRLTTFSDTTEPTAEEVERIISKAAADVFADLEADPVPIGRQQKARSLTTIRAGMYVELPTAGDDRSVYDDLKALYDEDLTKLKDAIVDAAGTGVDGASPDAPLPLGMFDVERVGWQSEW